MGMAPVAHVLFNKFMTFNPKNPKWVNRDRFVLSYVHTRSLLISFVLARKKKIHPLHIYGLIWPEELKRMKSLRSSKTSSLKPRFVMLRSSPWPHLMLSSPCR